MNEPIKIDIWSDIACPWCYIGKRRLEAGLAETGVPVEIEYHSFELVPDMPVDYDGSHADFLSGHLGVTAEQVKEMNARVGGIAESVGLHYDFEHMHPANTVKAHQVLHLAKANGVQEAMKERLLAAYFLEGRNLADHAALANLAAEVGLDRDEVLRVLENDELVDAVRADQRLAARYGIRGVPFYVFAGKYGVSGAQESEVFAQVLRKVAEDG
ncbi:DsbA family oxidoreductase [Fodinicola acaciae]|uniref:DsbA family oxidoreductase n=1 Tax=Fodinicola acaciae TaxID=2681555 RepID=UPI0013D76050|nr:DsbA family oxidoreductase [Fodinicola acaciae]